MNSLFHNLYSFLWHTSAWQKRSLRFLLTFTTTWSSQVEVICMLMMNTDSVQIKSFIHHTNIYTGFVGQSCGEGTLSVSYIFEYESLVALNLQIVLNLWARPYDRHAVWNVPYWMGDPNQDFQVLDSNQESVGPPWCWVGGSTALVWCTDVRPCCVPPSTSMLHTSVFLDISRL